MNVINQINKRVVKASRRMFFQLHNDTNTPVGGRLYIEIKGSINNANYKVDIRPILAKSFGFVYIDVPKDFFNAAVEFDWAWDSLKQDKNGRSAKWEGLGRLTEKFEDLYEGN